MARYFVIALLFTVSCLGHSSLLVEAEIDFSDKVVRSQNESLQEFLASCACKDGVYVDKKCSDAAEVTAVVKARWAYHVGMMKYNAKISKTRPAPTSLFASAPVCTEGQ